LVSSGEFSPYYDGPSQRHWFFRVEHLKMPDHPSLAVLAIVAGVALLAFILIDTFETIILPRGVARGTGLTRLFYRTMWRVWAALASRFRPRRRETFLSGFGPLSLPLLLSVWAFCLILGFGLVHWGVMEFQVLDRRPFWVDVYMSATTFFTLGIGDVAPSSALGRAFVAAEAGVGFGFLALVIGYLPVLYGAFSRRELHISLLDPRASSPPTAAELLRRYRQMDSLESLPRVLRDWELWAAELLESHLSYPVLAYYRSQHDRQSWLAAMTCVLDACALIRVGVKDVPPWQAKLTFAIARHAIVDLSLILDTEPRQPPEDRLPPKDLAALREMLAAAGLQLRVGGDADDQLAGIRRQYEPYLYALSEHLRLPLPPWLPDGGGTLDDWQITAWEVHDHL
jgi:hypothetical protein